MGEIQQYLRSIPGFTLDVAGFLVLADLRTILHHAALTGGASYLDVLFLMPGIHRQRYAAEVSGGEYPATGALTTGYVFRVENEAMVHYLQTVGKTGHLTNLTVTPRAKRLFPSRSGIWPSAAYAAGIALTLMAARALVAIQDWWGFSTLLMWMLSRLLNVVITKRRTKLGWKGMPEPGVRGDLLVLLTQDRWVRIRGMVDDLKVVTSGHWMSDETAVESLVLGAATFLVYGSAAVAGKASLAGNLLLAGLLVASSALLGLCNAWTSELRMFGRVVRMDGPPIAYARRLIMVNELIEETGRNDWAIGMGMIVPPQGSKPQTATM
jgi:hypothetical protein